MALSATSGVNPGQRSFPRHSLPVARFPGEQDVGGDL